MRTRDAVFALPTAVLMVEGPRGMLVPFRYAPPPSAAARTSTEEPETKRAETPPMAARQPSREEPVKVLAPAPPEPADKPDQRTVKPRRASKQEQAAEPAAPLAEPANEIARLRRLLRVVLVALVLLGLALVWALFGR